MCETGGPLTRNISRVGFPSGLAAFTSTVADEVVQILQVAGLLRFPDDEILIYGTSLCIVVPLILEMLALHHLTTPDGVLFGSGRPEEADHGGRLPRERDDGVRRSDGPLGAIIGPAIALSLVGVIALRHIFLIAFIPGAITVLIVVFALQDIPRPPQPALKIMASLRDLPRAFWRYAAAVGVFGFGNFAHTLLVLHAVTVLTPHFGAATAGRIGIALYITHCR